MPSVKVVFYKDEAGLAPSLEWLHSIPKRAKAKCIARIERLRAEGAALRRPEADYLRDGIFELRVGLQGINYRLLYFFSGQECVVLSHGIVKERLVPDKEIDLAVKRKAAFEANRLKHTFQE